MTTGVDLAQVAALIPAAGEGRRLGLGPKALVRVGETTLLELALRAFAGVGEVVAAVPEAWLAGAEAASSHPANARLIAGASTRQATVLGLLEATAAPYVVIHDAARPFLPRPVLERTLAGAVRHGAASAALAVADTLFDTVAEVALDRGALRAIQTPQAFRRELILAAHRRARRAGFTATDDAGLVRWAGHPVALVEGSALLFKITTRDDLRLARSFVGSWGEATHAPGR